ncbi:glycosyltransferase family 32 protein [Aspergillus saccharolyticus JOP 1030-1]|uniref:Alpha 1,6 mannosyltransferase n=1 Tax=Aspergillus saccharolyticus JOP 1030-1 TaxID=1450539 RepID=A0A318Z9K3_9EURO|nr:hypothetical protein BP01DRAFT_357995 [Aspergillus saccharolyticus JOP 1030-1]PYH44085.1 hypothetical protein BP01DRAFT_357995 [Aspergillus saccharolyticus JOP 1030-1]
MIASRYLRFVLLTVPVGCFLFLLSQNWNVLPRLFSPSTPDATLGLFEVPAPPQSSSSSSSSSSNHKPTTLSTTPLDPGVDTTNTNTAIPGITDKVWHSAQTPILSSDQTDWIHSWLLKNPSFRHELLTDDSALTFVRTRYGATRPDIVEVYEKLPIPILRADLLRYLIVLAEGGIWSDLDVTCDTAVRHWVPAEHQHARIDMIVGLEFDLGWRGEGMEVASQFCNWVFAARPGSRNLAAVVDAVVAQLNAMSARNGVGVESLTLDMLPMDVVNVTGPKIMTIALLDGLRRVLGRAVDDRDFHAIKAPTLVGDLLIMPGNAFAAAQNGFPTDQSPVLVSHHYAGSWKQADAEAKERKKLQQEQQQQQQQQQQ